MGKSEGKRPLETPRRRERDKMHESSRDKVEAHCELIRLRINGN